MRAFGRTVLRCAALRSETTRLVLVAGLCAAAGCGSDPPAGPSDAGGSSTCDLTGVTFEVRGPDQTFHEPPGEAELVLGFQGFRYLYVRVHTQGTPVPPFGSVNGKLDGGEPISQSFRLDLTSDGPGTWVTEPIMVLFDDVPLSALVDHDADLSVTVGDGTCVADTGGTVTLRFDPSCYEGPTGMRFCGDGGLPTPDDGGLLPLPDAGTAPPVDAGP